MARLNTVQLFTYDIWPYTHESMIPGQQEFYGPDKKELYQRNIKYMPEDWKYHYLPVEYNFNSHGLRMSKELDNLSDNVIYVSGTSYAMGIGIPEEERFSDVIANNLKYDYINYAGPTFSIKLQVYTFFNYVQRFKIPKICIFEYPPSDGYTFFEQSKSLTFYRKHLASDYPDHLSLYENMLKNDVLLNEAICYSNMLRIFCKKLNCKLIEISYHPNDRFVQNNGVKSIDINQLKLYNINDRYARDIMKQNESISAHPGTGVHSATANEILKNL